MPSSGQSQSCPDETKRRLNMSDPKKPNNARLGLILGGVALFFFALVFIKHIYL